MQILKPIFTLLLCLFVHFISTGQQLSVLANKNIYLTKEQVLFDVIKEDASKTYPLAVDLVAPSGQIISSKSLIKQAEDKLFFYLPDTLSTGIYRIIANSPGASQVEKRVHIYNTEKTDFPERELANVLVRINGGNLQKNIGSKLALRAVDEQGVGVPATISILDSRDSVVQFLQCDANGIASTIITPTDSLYKVNFAGHSISLNVTDSAPFSSFITQSSDSCTLKISGLNENVSVHINQKQYWSRADSASYFNLKNNLNPGVNEVVIMDSISKYRQRYVLFNDPTVKEEMATTDTKGYNLTIPVGSLKEGSTFVTSMYLAEQSRFFAFDWNQNKYFDQYPLDIKWVENRDIEAYSLFFYDQLKSSPNTARLNLIGKTGVLSFKDSTSFGRLSMLTVPGLEPIEMLREDITGIQAFEKWMPSQSSIVLPYLLAGNLIPEKQVSIIETIDLQYPAIKSTPQWNEEIEHYIQSIRNQQSIKESYDISDEENDLPAADFTYNMEDYQVPDTMEELINNLVKYLSVQNQNGKQNLSLYRYMTIYKFDSPPLILINNQPTYDPLYILNADPKSIEKVELRNSIHSTATLGNLGLKGVVSFYLKDGFENPLEEANSTLPVLRKREALSKKNNSNPNSPDFRSQLFWDVAGSVNTQNQLETTLSDIKEKYELICFEIKKNGSVIEKTGSYIVQ